MDDAVAALVPFPSPLSSLKPVPSSAEELSSSHERGSKDFDIPVHVF